MKKVVINEDGIFVPVDKETAIFLAKKGEELSTVENGNRTYLVYEMADDGRERTIEELIEEIMSSDQWYWGFYNESNMIKTKYKIGEEVYALIPDSPASFSPSKIKHLKIVGIKYQESYTNAELNTIQGSRKTDSELYVKGKESVKTTKYYLADSNSTYARGYMMYEDELFNSVEELKESL